MLKHYNFKYKIDDELGDGIVANGLLPVATIDKLIVGVCGMPTGCIESAINHVIEKHHNGLEASDYFVAICLIGKKCVGSFMRFGLDCDWVR